MITRLKLSTIEQGLPKYRSMLAGNDAFIPNSFESIATATGTGSSNIITFSSIPSTYQHLQIRGIMRDTSTSNNMDILSIKLNSATTNYASHNLYGDGSTVSASGTTASPYIRCLSTVPTSGTSMNNAFAGIIIDIHDYASTTKNTTVRVFTGCSDNSSYGNVSLHSGLWNNTAAITRIDLTTLSLNFTSTTTFALYGIKGA